MLLQGCAEPVREKNIEPMQEVYADIDKNPKLLADITLGTLTVSDTLEYSPIPLPTDEIKTALGAAMTTMGYSAQTQDTGQFLLNVTLLALDTPMMGMSFTTTSTVAYELVDKLSNTTIWKEKVTMPYVAQYGETPQDSQERLRLSIERSLRENITHMLRLLPYIKDTAPTAPTKEPQQ